MTPIKQNAPKGATHYSGTQYFAVDHNGVWKWCPKNRFWRTFNYGNKSKLKPL